MKLGALEMQTNNSILSHLKFMAIATSDSKAEGGINTFRNRSFNNHRECLNRLSQQSIYYFD
jgi:hypothetical protein